MLVACEHSGIVREAFSKRGHDAISCDLLPTDIPGPHHQGNIIPFLISKPDNYFDLIIAHPDCTKLCISGNGTYGLNKDRTPKPKHHERLAAAKWTQKFWNLCKLKASKVAFENPVGVLSNLTNIPKPHCIQPYQFGHSEQKRTGFHLHNLNPLQETDNVYGWMMLLPRKKREKVFFSGPGSERWKVRSKTYTGIADAMAEQWG